MGMERRVMPRIETSLEIAFNSSGVAQYSYMLNLSSGGIFIKTDHPLPIDAELVMSFQLPGDTEILHISGRVVWTKPDTRAFPAGMGIQFIDLQPAHKEKIRSFVAGNLSKKKSAAAP